MKTIKIELTEEEYKKTVNLLREKSKATYPSNEYYKIYSRLHVQHPKLQEVTSDEDK